MRKYGSSSRNKMTGPARPCLYLERLEVLVEVFIICKQIHGRGRGHALEKIVGRMSAGRSEYGN